MQKPEFKLLRQDAGMVEFLVTLPALVLQDSPSSQKLKMGALPCKPDQQGYLLPAFLTLLPGRLQDFSLKAADIQTAVVPSRLAPARFDGDQTNAAGSDSGIISQKRDSHSPSQPARKEGGGWAHLISLGEYREVPLTGLEILPVRWDGRRKEFLCLTSLKIRLEVKASLQAGQKPVRLPNSLGGLGLGLPLAAPAGQPPNLPQRNNSTTGERLKIYVSQEGIHHLSAADLASWGANLSNIDPRTLRLENRGAEQPIYVFGEADGRFDESDYVEFWGEGLHETYTDQNPEIYSDLYTDVNVYWLSWGGELGARLAEESGEVVEVDELKMFRATSYPYWIHSEENSYYNRLSQVDPDSLKEHWFYDSGVKASQTKNYGIFLPYPDDDALINVRVRVNLQGLTYPDAYGQGGQHHVYVNLNDQNTSALEAGSAGASWWLGQTGVILYAEGVEGISPTIMHHGVNTFSLFCPVDTDAGPNDTVLLNWFEITYQRLYKAYLDLIRFAPPEAASDTLVDYRIDGFTTSQIEIYKLGQSKIINAEIIPYQSDNQTLFKLHFQDRPFGSPQYIALTPSAKLLPDSAQMDPGSDIYNQLAAGAPIKLLVVAHRTFENQPELEDYLQRRQAGLGRTEVVYIDDVFDEYSNGIYSPQAIKDLLLSLPTPPEFLLLLGDASYDTRNLYGEGGNLVPAYYVQTRAYGAVASDFWFSRLDEDQIPDLAVGRIPARDPQELADFLNKLEEYETNPEPGKWHDTHLFVSGTGGVGGTTFLELSQQITTYVPGNVLIERLATDPITSPFYGGTTDLIDLFDAGALTVDYNGHGAGAVWSDNSLFRVENLPQLSNQGLYPFVTNFTCFIGAFDTPSPGTILGEEFIFEPEKGAIAVLGSTGLGWFINGSWLQEQLVDQIYQQPNLTLGELINAAKIAYYGYYGLGQSIESFDTIHLMNLLGDPSLHLAFAQSLPPAEATPAFVSYGDSVTVSMTGDYAGYEGTLRIYDEQGYPAFQFGQPYEIPTTTAVNGLQVSFLLPTLSDTTELTGGTYRLTWWNPSGEANLRSAASFYLASAYGDSVYIDSLAPYPNPVYADDACGFKAKVLDPQGIASAYVHFRIEDDMGGSIVEHDSLVLNPTTPAPWYQTDAAIDSSTYGYSVGDRVIAWIKVEDTAGDTLTGQESIFYILDSRADPAWVDESLTMGMRQNQAALIIQVENQGKTAVDSLEVAFYLLNPSPELLGSTIIYDLPPDSLMEAYVFSALNPGSQEFEMRMNENGWVDDANPTPPYQDFLAVDHFSVSSSAGTGDTLIVGGIYRSFIPAGGLSGSQGVLALRERSDLTLPATQEGISFVLQDSATNLGQGVELELLGDVQLISDSLYVAVDWSPNALPAADVSLHQQALGDNFWRLVDSEIDTLNPAPDLNLRFWVKSHEVGLYTLLHNTDHQGPTIEITVEGQIYTQGGYVPHQPKISALVQDLGGINAQPGTYWISLDGEAVDSSQITSSLESSGQVLTLSIAPTFVVGQHTMSVLAQDLAGNAGSASIEFQVAGQFNLGFLGNYPNPVKDKTYFAYSLSEQTTEPVKILIYTVSGRLIRTLHSASAEEINYGEIYWDGRDEDGSNIANGVYFYKFQARRGDDLIERTMKLAKLR